MRRNRARFSLKIVGQVVGGILLVYGAGAFIVWLWVGAF